MKNKAKVKALKQMLVEISQEICNQLEGCDVSFETETVTNHDLSGVKSTIIVDVKVQINEEI